MPILHDDEPQEGEVALNVCTLQLGQLHVLGEAGGQVARGKGQDTVALQLYTLLLCCNKVLLLDATLASKGSVFKNQIA